MAFPIIAYANWADLAIFGGGSWLSSLPLTNLGEPTLGRLARSVSTDPNTTKFTVDIGVGRLARVIGLLNHNIRTNGQYRLKGSNDVSFSTVSIDTGFQPVWPAVYPPSQLEWESDNFWFGTYTQDEIVGYPWHLIIPLSASKRLRYWSLEINDSGNPDGFVQAGRLFIGDGWQPANGIPYGAGIAWEDPTSKIKALSGASYSDKKKPYRVARITTHFMEDDEAYSKAFEIQRRSATWKEVVYIHDPDDTIHSIRRRFPGTLRTLGPIDNPYPNANQAAWEIEEILP